MTTTFTNFPANATMGESLTLHAFQSGSEAQFEYKEFTEDNDMRVVSPNSSRTIWAVLIGQVDSPYYTKSQLKRLKKQDLFDLCDEHKLYYLDSYLRDDLIAQLLTVTIEEFYKTYFAFRGFFAREGITHPYHVTRGYCQGDAVIVINAGSVYDLNNAETQTYIDHVFWDTPAYIVLNKDEGEDYFYLGEALADKYNYDKDEIISKLGDFNLSDYAKTWVAETLPDTLDYAD